MIKKNFIIIIAILLGGGHTVSNASILTETEFVVYNINVRASGVEVSGHLYGHTDLDRYREVDIDRDGSIDVYEAFAPEGIITIKSDAFGEFTMNSRDSIADEGAWFQAVIYLDGSTQGSQNSINKPIGLFFDWFSDDNDKGIYMQSSIFDDFPLLSIGNKGKGISTRDFTSEITVIPLPSAAWLLGSSLVLLFNKRLRTKIF